MATHMVKYGSSDNIKTFEHWCDTYADLATIDSSQINLGSVAVVIEGQSGGLEIYVAKSDKSWKLATANAGASENNNLTVTIQDYEFETIPQEFEEEPEVRFFSLDKSLDEIAEYFSDSNKSITIINDTDYTDFDECHIVDVRAMTSMSQSFGVEISPLADSTLTYFFQSDLVENELICGIAIK